MDFIYWDILTFDMFRPSNLRRMHQSVADPKYEGVQTSRKELMEIEGDNSGEDDEESHHEEDEIESEQGRVRFDVPSENEEEDNSGEDDEESHHDEDEESEEGRVRFNVSLEKQSWKSNGAMSDDDVTSESEDGSEASHRGNKNITSNRSTPSKQQSENLGPTEDVSSTLKKKREEDLEKGQAVKRQVVCPFCLRDSVRLG